MFEHRSILSHLTIHEKEQIYRPIVDSESISRLSPNQTLVNYA